ncbi:MAG: hypothetical protein GY884_03500 [Proteobacteria bacterium]|nr:hypothetical protein [Pseudomonadota bacterium]
MSRLGVLGVGGFFWLLLTEPRPVARRETTIDLWPRWLRSRKRRMVDAFTDVPGPIHALILGTLFVSVVVVTLVSVALS